MQLGACSLFLNMFLIEFVEVWINLDEFNHHVGILTNSADTLNTVLVRRDVVYTGVQRNFPRLITHSLLDNAITEVQAQREQETVNSTVRVVKAVNFLSSLAAGGELDREKASLSS